MRMTWFGSVMSVSVVVLAVTVAAQGQAAGGGRGGQGAGRGGAPVPGPAPAAAPVARSPVVDQAAHDRGRAIWATECIDCHGSTARGSEKGPNIIRTKTVNYDRSAVTAGSVLGPYLKAGHPTQSGKASASFTADETVALANFLRQKVNDTMRGAAVFTVGDILVGNKQAGQAYFEGEGKCTTCHNATTRNLAGIGTRIPAPVDIQQRMLFPGGARGRGAGAGPNPNAITATITPASGPAVSGVVVEQSDFFVTLRLADGTIRVVRRAPGMKIVITNPMQAHIDLLDVLSDTQIHDLVAYLESLK